MEALHAISQLTGSEVTYCLVALTSNLSMAPNCSAMLASPEANNGVDIVNILVKSIGGPLLVMQVSRMSRAFTTIIINDGMSVGGLLSAGPSVPSDGLLRGSHRPCAQRSRSCDAIAADPIENQTSNPSSHHICRSMV